MLPDVRALGDRELDYLVPTSFAPLVAPGLVVRVPLHGRRVRAWVVDSPVVPAVDPSRLRPLSGVLSAGPPAEVVALTAWAAWRWAGSRQTFLRAASPPLLVPPRPVEQRVAPPGPGCEPEVVLWSPCASVGQEVTARVAPTGSTIVVCPDPRQVGDVAAAIRRAGSPHSVVHYRTSPARTRAGAWVSARGGGCVVVGGRLAALAPVPDLAAIVILDDLDEALREERSPTWHARELCVERARRAGVPLTFISPVPSIESSVLAGGWRAGLSRTEERAGWPIVEVVDPHSDPSGPGVLTGRLAMEVRRATAAGGRALCVLERRGRARLLACKACGALARCERCGAAVAEVAEEAGGVAGAARALGCSLCDLRRPWVCAGCGSTRLSVLRAGVAKLRDDLAALLRVDVGLVEASTPAVSEASVLVGTSSLLHRVESAALVAFVDFDQELLAPRYRATEAAMWLLVRAARVVGPRASGGRILVQTRLTDHPVLHAAVHADPKGLIEGLRGERRELGLPPFGAMAELRGDEPALEAAEAGLEAHAITVAGKAAGARLVRSHEVRALADALSAVLPEARCHGRLRVAMEPRGA